MPKLNPETLAEIARAGAPPALTPEPSPTASNGSVPSGATEARPAPGAVVKSRPELAQPATSMKARRTKGKGREYPRISLDLSRDMHLAFSQALLEERFEAGRAIAMTEILRDLVSLWLTDEGLREKVRGLLEAEDGEKPVEDG